MFQAVTLLFLLKIMVPVFSRILQMKFLIDRCSINDDRLAQAFGAGGWLFQTRLRGRANLDGFCAVVGWQVEQTLPPRPGALWKGECGEIAVLLVRAGVPDEPPGAAGGAGVEINPPRKRAFRWPRRPAGFRPATGWRSCRARSRRRGRARSIFDCHPGRNTRRRPW